MTQPLTPPQADLVREETVPFEQRFATVLRYCDDPQYRSLIDAETAAEQARLNAIISANIARYRARKAAEALS